MIMRPRGAEVDPLKSFNMELSNFKKDQYTAHQQMVRSFKFKPRNVRDFSQTTGEFKRAIKAEQTVSKSQVAEITGLYATHFQSAADKYTTDVRSYNASNLRSQRPPAKETLPKVKKSKTKAKSKGKQKSTYRSVV